MHGNSVVVLQWPKKNSVRSSVLHCVAVCCSVLDVLKCVAVCCMLSRQTEKSTTKALTIEVVAR